MIKKILLEDKVKRIYQKLGLSKTFNIVNKNEEAKKFFESGMNNEIFSYDLEDRKYLIVVVELYRVLYLVLDEDMEEVAYEVVDEENIINYL